MSLGNKQFESTHNNLVNSNANGSNVVFSHQSKTTTRQPDKC